jgi:hypothetical protein
MLFFFLTGFALAASPNLGKGLTVVVDSSKRDPWSPMKENGAEVLMELETRYTSTGLENDKRIPLADTLTLQTQKIVLSKEKKGEAQVTFPKFQVSADVFLPGAARPFQQQFRLDDALAAIPLRFNRNDRALEILDFAPWQKRAEASIREPLARRAFSTTFTKDNVAALLSEESRKPLCWQDKVVASKKPGDKWIVEEESQGFRFKQNCEFKGWGKASNGAVIGWISYTVTRSETIKKQPNGVEGRVSIFGGGNLWISKGDQQWFDHKILNIEAWPMESEIRSLKAKGKPVPGNHTLLETAMRVTVNISP